jgi:hypothetical protein
LSLLLGVVKATSGLVKEDVVVLGEPVVLEVVEADFKVL